MVVYVKLMFLIMLNIHKKKEKTSPDGNFFQRCIKKSEYFMKTYLNNLYIYENYLKNNISKLY